MLVDLCMIELYMAAAHTMKLKPIDPHEVVKLLRLGELALAEGKRERAYRTWQQAALLDPTNESAWLALLNVLDSLEDRRVALRNILTINPNNFHARQLLDEVNSALTIDVMSLPQPSDHTARSRWLALFSVIIRVALTVTELVLIALFTALALLLLARLV